MNINQKLKANNLTKTEFAKKLYISRPTLDKYIDSYMKGEELKESFQSIFDAFFKEEKEIPMEGKYRCLNNNILVRLVEDTAVNSNGTRVSGTETRGKRDVVAGEIIACGNTNIKPSAKIYFSFYAAQPMMLEGEQVYIVNYSDIKFIKED